MSTIDTSKLDGLRGGELAQYVEHIGVVGCDGTALTEVAGRARQDEVFFAAHAPLRGGDPVVQVEDPTFGVEELQDPAHRHIRSDRSAPAVLAHSAVPLADSVADRRADVAAIRHATRVADRAAPHRRMTRIGKGVGQ